MVLLCCDCRMNKLFLDLVLGHILLKIIRLNIYIVTSYNKTSDFIATQKYQQIFFNFEFSMKKMC